MTTNMGLPKVPKSAALDGKEFAGTRLRRGMGNAGQSYGAPFRRELGNVSISENLDASQHLKTTLAHLQDRLDCIPPLAVAIFDEPSHDDCAGRCHDGESIGWNA